MKFEINNTEFLVEEYDDGYGWSSWDGNLCLEESIGYFKTEWEAQQNAINYIIEKEIEEEEQREQEENDRIYGTEQEQWRKDYYDSIRLN